MSLGIARQTAFVGIMSTATAHPVMGHNSHAPP